MRRYIGTYTDMNPDSWMQNRNQVKDVGNIMAWDKGSEIASKTEMSLDKRAINDYGDTFDVKDLVSDVAFSRQTPTRSSQFDSGRAYSKAIQEHLHRDGAFPKAKDYPRDLRIERDDI